MTGLNKCNRCDGTGKRFLIEDKDPYEGYKTACKKPCPDCNATGVTRQAQTAPEVGPVRTVTRHEIVPGVYGKYKVCAAGESEQGKYVTLQIGGTRFFKGDMDALIHDLTAIRDAMQENITG